jgi:hypothetical protein
MPENLGQKGLTKVVKICVTITPDFSVKGTNGCQRGIMVLKREQNVVKIRMGQSTPAFASFLAGYFQP